jgi:hypothetical protein
MKSPESAVIDTVLRKACRSDRSEAAAPHPYMNLELARAIAYEQEKKARAMLAGVHWFLDKLDELVKARDNATQCIQSALRHNPGQSDSAPDEQADDGQGEQHDGGS